jgi:hypothetical protein
MLSRGQVDGQFPKTTRQDWTKFPRNDRHCQWQVLDSFKFQFGYRYWCASNQLQA